MDITSSRRELVRLAKALLAREIDTIEGLRLMNSLRAFLPESDDPVFHTITALESETDDVPVGKLRTEYDPTYLAALDKEMGRYLPLNEDALFGDLREIIKRYDTGL